MNSKELKRHQLYINNLSKRLEDYRNQLEFLYDQKPSSQDELENINSLEDSIDTLEKELNFSINAYNYLSDNTLVHDMEDLRNLFFGEYKKIYSDIQKVSVEWRRLVNLYRSDEEMLYDLTDNFINDKKYKVIKRMKRKLGDSV